MLRSLVQKLEAMNQFLFLECNVLAINLARISVNLKFSGHVWTVSGNASAGPLPHPVSLLDPA